MTLELIKIKHKSTNSVNDLLTSLCHFVAYPYEYWHEEYNAEQEHIYFDNDDHFAQDVNNGDDYGQDVNNGDDVNVDNNGSLTSTIRVANDLIYADVRVSETKNSKKRIPLAELLAQDDEEDEEEDNFNYVKSTLNYEPINKMFAERRQERLEMEQAIASRVSLITENEIEEEVYKLWEQERKSNPKSKRKYERITKEDIAKANLRIKKRIRLEEEGNVHLRYRKRHLTQL